MDELTEEEKGKFELLDGKKIPMRHFNVDLTSQEIAMIALSITESIMPSMVVSMQDKLTYLDKKVAILEKLLKVMELKGFSNELKEGAKKISGICKELNKEVRE